MSKLSIIILGSFIKPVGVWFTRIQTYTTRIILALIVLLFPLQQVESAESIATIYRISPRLDNGSQFMSIRLLGVLRLANVSRDSIEISELSDLAWDEDEQLLYAVSDQGYLLHLQPVFKNDIIVDVLLSGKHVLLDNSGVRLQGNDADSEGLDIINSNNNIKGDSELLVSFERNPRIERYSPQGTFLGSFRLPTELVSIKNYLSKNKALESVALHPEHGIITVPERPLTHSANGMFTLYGLQGDNWSYTPLDPDVSAITSLATHTNENLIVLERIYSNQYSPFSVAIRELLFSDVHATPEIKTLALFKQDDGFLIDNFEGLTHHKDNRFFMVSDNNENFFQSTLLMYFEILD